MARSKHRSKLVRMAFITAPLLGVYNVVPISLLFSSSRFVAQLPPQPFPFPESLRLLIPMALITLTALILWFFNIWLNNFLEKRHWRKRSILYLLSYAFTFLLILTFSMGRPESMDVGNLRFYPFIGSAANNTFILIMIDLILTRGRRAELELEKANMEAANITARLETLKHQIHPHFLFNALNTLKILISKNEEKANNYVVRLSNFLRASISEGIKEKVAIRNDLNIMIDYLELQKVRFPSAIDYIETLSDNILDNRAIPAFTLQMLAENAIKHNSFSKKDPLKISITQIDNYISFSNNILPKNEKNISTGIGLKNLSERFRILSGIEPVVEKDNIDNVFIVKMKALKL